MGLGDNELHRCYFVKYMYIKAFSINGKQNILYIFVMQLDHDVIKCKNQVNWFNLKVSNISLISSAVVYYHIESYFLQTA